MANESEYKRTTRDSGGETPDVHNIGNPDVSHEKNDVNVFAIIKFVVGLTIGTFAVFGLMFGLLKVLNTVETRKDAPSSPLARTERERLPPNPRLQVARGHGFTPEDLTNDPAIRRELAQEPGQLDLQLKEPTVEWDELRKVKLRELQSYGKDVQRPGEFRIPIERAKQLLLEHSQLAARPQPEQQAPGSAQVTGAITGAEASELVRRSEGYDTLPTYQSSGQKAERRRQ